MCDLINREDVIKCLQENGWLDDTNIDELIEIIPTTYDIDKVIEELESEMKKGNIVIDFGEFRLFEIVKQGGVSDDVCEWKVKSNYYVTKCSHDTDVMYGLKQDFKFCPFCGKKIKVI